MVPLFPKLRLTLFRDSTNALTHIILVFNAREFLVPSETPIFLKYNVNIDKLLNLYQYVKSQLLLYISRSRK